jgi:4'-phosphopantetheinyl transferase EntD
VTSNVASHICAAFRAARWHRAVGTDGTDIPVRLLEFDVSEFDSRAFADIGIHCPPNISRSARKRQSEFFFGRLAARQVLSSITADLALANIGIGVSREPLWPEGVIGSITHNRSFAGATAEMRGHRRGIGIDIEGIVCSETVHAMLDTVINHQEMREMSVQARSWSTLALLTLAFSAKESFFKGAYQSVGQFFDFDAARIVAMDPGRGRLRLRLMQTLCDYFVEGQEYELGFEFIDPHTIITHFVW